MASFEDRINGEGQAPTDAAGSLAELLARGGSSDDFLTQLLAVQCRQAKADAAAILRQGPANGLELLATYPPPRNGHRPAWIDRTERPYRKAVQTARTVIMRQSPNGNGDGQSKRYLMVVPIESRGVVRAAAAFQLNAQHQHSLLLSRAHLENTALVLDHHELQLTTQMHQAAMARFRRVLAVLDIVNRPTRFLGAAMALCNEMAAWLDCSRVSLGLLEGRSVKVMAISHTDAFSREMQMVSAIEAAMEECLDQDLEVVHPCHADAPLASRAAASLGEQHGPSAVISLPIRHDGDVAGVITLERKLDRPFARAEEIEAIRLVCDLCAPRLLALRRNDGWFGARLLKETRQWAGQLLGHQHTWAKLAAGLAFLAVVLLVTVKGEHRIDTTFTLKAQHQQAVVAPFDTFSKSVHVEPGDRVAAQETLLGTLETSELRLKLAALKAEQHGYRKQMTAFMRDRKTADAQIAESQSQKVAAQIRLIEKQIDQARIVAPIDGWVISEDRKQQIGAPVEAGDVLFEIASIDALWAELYVPEASIANVHEGLEGTLAAVGHPDRKIAFTIVRINPIAEVVDNQNVFRIRTRIAAQPAWMRPGMEGEARISAGRKSILWIYAHPFVNWLRMKLWI